MYNFLYCNYIQVHLIYFYVFFCHFDYFEKEDTFLYSTFSSYAHLSAVCRDLADIRRSND